MSDKITTFDWQGTQAINGVEYVALHTVFPHSFKTGDRVRVKENVGIGAYDGIHRVISADCTDDYCAQRWGGEILVLDIKRRDHPNYEIGGTIDKIDKGGGFKTKHILYGLGVIVTILGTFIILKKKK